MMKTFIFSAVVLVLSLMANAFAAKMPKMVQVRVFESVEMIDDMTGERLSKTEIIKKHSTVFDYVNVVEVSKKNPKIVLLSRSTHKDDKARVGEIYFTSMDAAEQFMNQMMVGQVSSVGFPLPSMGEYLSESSSGVIISK